MTPRTARMAYNAGAEVLEPPRAVLARSQFVGARGEHGPLPARDFVPVSLAKLLLHPLLVWSAGQGVRRLTRRHCGGFVTDVLEGGGAQVALAGIWQDDDNHFPGILGPGGDLHRTHRCRTAGDADERALLSRQCVAFDSTREAEVQQPHNPARLHKDVAGF